MMSRNLVTFHLFVTWWRCLPSWGRANALAAAALAVAFGLATGASYAETWGERLGYPPEAKVIVLHAHDAGLCHEANTAVLELCGGPVVRSTSAMATCPWFADFAASAKHQQEVDLGLQLTLNSEWKTYRWRPVAMRQNVASLIDADGYLWQKPVQTMVSATVEDVQMELAAQMQQARMLGYRPTHLTTHLGTLFTRPDLVATYLTFAQVHWIPAVVIELTPERLAEFQRMGFPLPDDLIQLLADYPLPKVDDLRFVEPAATYDEKKAQLLGMIDQLGPGITEIAFAPVADGGAIRRISPRWQQRVWDFQLFQDEEVMARLRADDVVLTDWREIMQRFEGSNQ